MKGKNAAEELPFTLKENLSTEIGTLKRGSRKEVFKGKVETAHMGRRGSRRISV